MFMYAPILRITDMGNDFVVCIDAFKEALSQVLMQER